MINQKLILLVAGMSVEWLQDITLVFEKNKCSLYEVHKKFSTLQP